MRFKQILKEKNLSVENLPKATQNKIKELESIEERIKSYENSELSEEEQEYVKEAKSRLDDLDRDLEKTLLKFNPEIYKKRLEHIKKIHGKNDDTVVKVEVQEAEIVEEKPKEVKNEVQIQPKVEEKPKLQVVTEAEVVEEPKTEARVFELRKVVSEENENKVNKTEINKQIEVEEVSKEKIKEELKNLKESINVLSNNTVTEELKTEEKIKPKNKKLSLILIGAGAFLLTWGAVNFFKDNR